MKLPFAPVAGQISAHRQLLIRGGWVAALSLLVKLAAMTKDIFVGRSFGASEDLDAFLVALVLPLFIWSVVSQSFSSAFIPVLVKVCQQEGLAASHALIRAMFGKIIVALALLTLLLAASAPLLLPIVAGGFDADQIATTERLYRILVWLVPLSGISTFWGAILNASEAFTMVALAPAAVPVMGLTAMIWLVPQYGIDALAWGTVAGYGAEFLLLYTAIRLRGTPILPVWRGHAEAGYIIRQYGCLFGGTLLMSSSLLVDQSMATWVGEGSVTVLTYGYKLVAVLLGTVSLGLTTAVFPHFSQLVASGQRADIEHTLKRLVKLVLLSSIPLTAFLILFSRPIVSLLFESSAMDADTVTTIAIVQACYLLHVPIFMASVLGARLLTALGGSHILLQNSVINLLANCIGNLLLLKLFGIAGIALSTSCVYLLSAWLIYRGLRLRLNELVAAELLKSRPARAA